MDIVDLGSKKKSGKGKTGGEKTGGCREEERTQTGCVKNLVRTERKRKGKVGVGNKKNKGRKSRAVR